MPLSNPAHETFAQARASGQAVEEAFATSGIVACRNEAYHLNDHPDVKARIMELRFQAAGRVADAVAATGDATDLKLHIARDLRTIIHASIDQAHEDHPLCETRLGKNGFYYRFPSKLAAMARLIKLMNWSQPEPPSPPSPCTPASSPAPSARAQESEISNPEISNPSPIEPPPSTVHPFSSRIEDPASRIEPPPSGTATPASNIQKPTSKIQLRYQKHHAIRDLLAIIHARPTDADLTHPLCEMYISPSGRYCRFPSKLRSISLLFRLLPHPA